MQYPFPSRSRNVVILVMALTISIGGCWQTCGSDEGDQAEVVDANDPDMAEAIAKAREQLPQFWQAFERRDHGESNFGLKAKVTAENAVEHFWFTNIERRDGQIFGAVNNEPSAAKSVRVGDRRMIPEADISDWMYTRDSKVVGNFSVRALLKRMPTEQVERYKRILADP